MLQAQQDANNHATTRRQRADQERNMSVRMALALIKAGHPERAHALLCLSVGMQCHLEGLAL